jgi:ubiquinone/menaquinone biosynthesis C-methylase UbiE
MAAGFDRIARAYRWLEYFSFGPLLEQCRFFRLDRDREPLASRRNALVIGDGDGRFLARLLGGNPELQAEAVDSSTAMLNLLRDRVAAAGAADRLTVRCEDARRLDLAGHYDLTVTHFFLDCLTTEEVLALARLIRPRLTPGAMWIVSEFAIPGGAMALPARTMVASLYAAFGVLTGLQARVLPRYGEALRSAGFRLADRREWLGGILCSERWEIEATAGAEMISH